MATHLAKTGAFEGKVCIVTGAAQGIGLATARRMAAAGGRLVLVDRVADACHRLRDEIVAEGGTAMAIAVDLETEEGAQRMVAETLAAHARIDVAVHNVGGTMWTKPFWEYKVVEVEKEIRRSLWPTLLCCHAVIPVMMKQGGGSIVNVGSVATRGINRVPYAAAKGGVSALTVALSMELASHHIRVNCVAPGGIASNRVIPRNTEVPSDAEKQWRADVFAQTLRDTPMNRLGEAHEVAAAIEFLASDDASYITGHVMYASGGGIG